MESKRNNHLIFKIFIGIVLFSAIVSATGSAWAQRLAVSASVANIRSGPGTKYDVLWRAEKYTPIIILDKDKTGTWYFFADFEGTKAWISKKLVKKIDTVITKKDKCNIRKGPGTNYNIAFKAEKGVPFKVLGRKGNWIHIQHADGDTGWIHKVLVW